MAAFPTFQSALITQCGETPSKVAQLSDIRSPQESGYVVTWTRTTRDVKSWRVLLSYIDSTDYATMSAFIATYGTVGSWDFTLPKAGTTHTVRFVKRPSMPYSAPYWSCAFEIEEV